MNMKVEIDPESGFCYGVVRAIDKAEELLYSDKELYSLGAIVHNQAEIDRLKGIGLKYTDHSVLENLRNTSVLIRAHGEPPKTYQTAHANNLEIIDCTCPVVIKLQNKIKEEYRRLQETGGGTILIFGKLGHAEVNGLIGQVDGDALVIERMEDIDAAISSGLLDRSKPMVIFSQTTKDPIEYSHICKYLESISNKDIHDGFKSFNTICKKVASRHKHLIKFAQDHSIILFISGKDSSNGRILYELCRSVNPRSYFIQNKLQIDPSWFQDGDFIGVCGATSTPFWQLEEISQFISENL